VTTDQVNRSQLFSQGN